MSLAGKAALVTGASKGIGRAVAAALQAAGAQVMICARSRADVEKTAAELGVRGQPCDVSDESAVRALVQATVGAFGGLDILVNNAGVGLLANIADQSPADWRRTIDTNLSGVFYCCHFAIPEMKKRGGGHIVNMASRSSVNAYAGGGAYCASKYGLLGLSESLLLELRDDGIRVSCIMPGRVSTDFAGEAPQDWHIAPEDVAQAVIDALSFNPRSVASCIELRPSKPVYR